MLELICVVVPAVIFGIIAIIWGFKVAVVACMLTIGLPVLLGQFFECYRQRTIVPLIILFYPSCVFFGFFATCVVTVGILLAAYVLDKLGY